MNEEEALEKIAQEFAKKRARKKIYKAIKPTRADYANAFIQMIKNSL